MRNLLTTVLSITLVLFIAMGCSLGGLIGSDSDTKKSLDSKENSESKSAGETIKVGILECDELATYIDDNSEEIEGSFATKAIIYFYKNYILDSIKEGVEKMSDEEKEKVAKACTKTLKQLKEQIKK